MVLVHYTEMFVGAIKSLCCVRTGIMTTSVLGFIQNAV